MKAHLVVAVSGLGAQTACMVDEMNVTVSRERRRELKHRIAEIGRRFDAWAARGDDGAWSAGGWDCLVTPVVGLLSTGAPAEEIASRIGAQMRAHYGLAGVISVPDVVFAFELRYWWDDQERRAR